MGKQTVSGFCMDNWHHLVDTSCYNIYLNKLLGCATLVGVTDSFWWLMIVTTLVTWHTCILRETTC